MPTECSRDLFGFEAVEGRQVVAGVRRRTGHLGRRRAAAGRHQSGARTGAAPGAMLHRWPCAGAGGAHRRDHADAAHLRHRAGLRGPGRPRRAAWPPERGWGPVPQPGGQATRCWRPWSASSRRGAPIAPRWPARARSTGSSPRHWGPADRRDQGDLGRSGHRHMGAGQALRPPVLERGAAVAARSRDPATAVARPDPCGRRAGGPDAAQLPLTLARALLRRPRLDRGAHVVRQQVRFEAESTRPRCAR